MPWGKFTLSKAVEDFNLTIVEGDREWPDIHPVTPILLIDRSPVEQILGFLIWMVQND